VRAYSCISRCQTACVQLSRVSTRAGAAAGSRTSMLTRSSRDRPWSGCTSILRTCRKRSGRCSHLTSSEPRRPSLRRSPPWMECSAPRRCQFGAPNGAEVHLPDRPTSQRLVGLLRKWAYFPRGFRGPARIGAWLRDALRAAAERLDLALRLYDLPELAISVLECPRPDLEAALRLAVEHVGGLSARFPGPPIPPPAASDNVR